MSADPVTDYAERVTGGAIVAGPMVRLACQRHLDDLVNGPNRGLEWRPDTARWVIEFFPAALKLPEGTDDDGNPLPFNLSLWQQFITGSLFGWYGDDGYRRFRTAYIEVGKGNGKSPWAAGTGLYMLLADGEQGAQIYSAATTRDQAKIVWTDAQKMVQADDELRGRIVETVNNLAFHDTGSFFRPVSADASKLDGFRPSCVIADEVHEHPNDRVINKMRAGFKGRKNPLIIEITNSGVDRTSVCYQHHEYTKKLLEGHVTNDSWFGYVCGLDEDDDPFTDESCWVKANPNLGVSISHKYLREQVTEAYGMPSKESIVRRLNFCQWVDAENPWIDGDLWRVCEVVGLEVSSDGAALAIDLTSKRDLAACAKAWLADDGVIEAEVRFWTPKETLDERERSDRVPYSAWVKAGHLIAVPGRAMDYGYVVNDIAEWLQSANGLAFDPWRIEDFQRALDDAGIDSYLADKEPAQNGLRLVRHGQGYGGGASDKQLWMPRSIGELEQAVLEGRLRVRKNPVLTWNSASAVLMADPAGNKKWEKRKSTGRIDGIVALSMAVGLVMQPTQKPPTYDIMFIG